MPFLFLSVADFEVCWWMTLRLGVEYDPGCVPGFRPPVSSSYLKSDCSGGRPVGTNIRVLAIDKFLRSMLTIGQTRQVRSRALKGKMTAHAPSRGCPDQGMVCHPPPDPSQ